MALPDFKYFERPDLFSVFLDEEATCDICEETKSCFDASSFYGTESIEAICPDCLAGGALKGRDIFTCEGDIEELSGQLKEINPALSADVIQRIAGNKTAELEETTPKLISWQDWAWPCAEGDYCKFIGFGSKALYNRLAEGNDGINLFLDSLYHSVKEEGEPEELWEEALPDKAIKDYDASQEYETLFYVFKSLHSGKIVTLWDVA